MFHAKGLASRLALKRFRFPLPVSQGSRIIVARRSQIHRVSDLLALQSHERSSRGTIEIPRPRVTCFLMPNASALSEVKKSHVFKSRFDTSLPRHQLKTALKQRRRRRCLRYLQGLQKAMISSRQIYTSWQIPRCFIEVSISVLSIRIHNRRNVYNDSCKVCTIPTTKPMILIALESGGLDF